VSPKQPSRRRPAAGPSPRTLPASALEPYQFERGGETYELPAFGSLKSGVIRRIRNMDLGDAFYELLESCTDERTLAAIDDMSMTELGDLLAGWQRQAEVTLGELQRSSS
jgi:hypothetical protein